MFADFLFYFVVVSSCVLLLSTSSSPVFLVFCFPVVFLCWYSPHIPLTSALLALPCFQCLYVHPIPSLVKFVLKPVLFPHSALVRLFCSHESHACCATRVSAVFHELMVCSFGFCISSWICLRLFLLVSVTGFLDQSERGLRKNVIAYIITALSEKQSPLYKWRKISSL